MKILLGLFFTAGVFWVTANGQQSNQHCKNMAYENRNQTDYGPLRLSVVRGVANDDQRVPIPKACVGLFAETNHKLIVVTETDNEGRFDLAGIPSGNYRLVVTYEGLCPANARVRVAASMRRAKQVVVHLRPAGIDTCSYVDLK